MTELRLLSNSLSHSPTKLTQLNSTQLSAYNISARTKEKTPFNYFCAIVAACGLLLIKGRCLVVRFAVVA
jgi:hypothetical protein